MTDLKTHDGWYYVSSRKATFGFEVADGRVVTTAPYGRSWLLGLNVKDAIEQLTMNGYAVIGARNER